MGMRTNFYKNPSYAYNKQFNLNSVLQNLKSYNIAIGNATEDEPAPFVQRKRRRESKNEVKEHDGPMSHQEYIEKLRYRPVCTCGGEFCLEKVPRRKREGIAYKLFQAIRLFQLG